MPAKFPANTCFFGKQNSLESKTEITRTVFETRWNHLQDWDYEKLRQEYLFPVRIRSVRIFREPTFQNPFFLLKDFFNRPK